jgi:hypothetical protein
MMQVNMSLEEDKASLNWLASYKTNRREPERTYLAGSHNLALTLA